MSYLFTSESVSVGHPDKMADQISDAILDECLRADPHARVACETMVCKGLIVLAGEITTKATVDYQEIAREVVRRIGYDNCDYGFDYRSCGIIVALNKQSPDIALGVDEDTAAEGKQGAGDQGIMFGYACDETPELMPLPIMLAHKIVDELRRLRESKALPYLRPDAKAQVTIEYSDDHIPLAVHTVVVSTQHAEEVTNEQLIADVKQMIKSVIPQHLLKETTRYYINPTGRFVIGGPVADCGLTGRKTIVDTYGGTGRHGGGAFSGKDPSKVDRSAAYAARYVAKNIVAAKLAKRCEVQVSYAIGVADPISIKIETFGTNKVPETDLEKAVERLFDLSPKGIINMLDLNRPIYEATASGGHFGREEGEFTWERLDRVADLLGAV